MNNLEFVNTLKHIASLPTVYNNKYPNNCGYYDGNKYSFDCWNLIKAVINGWKDTKVKGSYIHPGDKSITKDCDGLVILNKCTKKSTDFKQLNIPGAYLFIRNNHAGVYIGETVVDGKTYNAIECTTSWSAKKVIYSWVDPDGTRRRCKGGTASKKWTDWGLMCWIDYNSVNDDNSVKIEPITKPIDKPQNEPESNNKANVLTKYQVNHIKGLNVRSSSDKKSTKIGGLAYKAIFEVETVIVKNESIENIWGYVPAKKGWCCLNYAKKI